MRRERNKCKRKERVTKLRGKLDAEVHKRKCAELSVISFKNRARTFWERWRWELQKRKEAMVSEIQARSRGGLQSTPCRQSLQELDPSMLLVIGQQECYAGRGSFGIVKVQSFRGMQVAVKMFLPRSLNNS